MIVRSRAPLRLGLAGGGTDVSPFCDLHGGYVMNVTIGKYAYVTVDPSPEGMTEFHALDAGVSQVSPPDGIDLAAGPLQLMKGVYQRVTERFLGGRPPPIRVRAHSDAPPGSGLGSSSTMVVALVTAFVEYFGLALGDYDVAHLAYQIEREDLGLSGGKQDQYAAAFGGFNFIEFYASDRVIVNPLRVKRWVWAELEASMVLYFTGVSRQSAAIITEQKKNVEAKSQSSLDASFALKREAVSMKESILKGDFAALAESMRLGWAWKKQLATQITNPMIDETYDTACRHGALAGKVSGAGGGGFMFFLVDPPRRMEVMRALQALGGQAGGCHFSKHGTEGWKL